LPALQLPEISVGKIVEVMPAALAIALLGGIESLLSAVVADAMTGRRHRSNCELVAQGIANVGSALVGGLCVTGTIARTATNVRSGANGPVSGLLHSVFLLLFILVAAPLASFIPLAALAGILVVVAANMADRHEFLAVLRRSRGEAFVLLATFLLTVFRDLTEGIFVGVVLGSFLFMHRMAQVVAVEVGTPLIDEDAADAPGGRADYEGREATTTDIMVYRIAGPLFFGASATIATVLERIGEFPKAVILDLSNVPFADSTAAGSMRVFAQRAARQGVQVLIAGASRPVRRVLMRQGLRRPLVRYAPSVADARMTAAHAGSAGEGGKVYAPTQT
jgi:sulfate permease, SulP family